MWIVHNILSIWYVEALAPRNSLTADFQSWICFCIHGAVRWRRK
jgi:hypothetical protein